MKWMGRMAIAGMAWLCAIAVHASDLLDPEDAFTFSAVVADDGKTIEAHFGVADGYYLYRDRLSFTASNGVGLGGPQYPVGEVKFDETFNRPLVVYRHEAVVKVPVESGRDGFVLTAKLQGCADQGVCYPPEMRTTKLMLAAPLVRTAQAAPDASGASANSSPPGESRVAAALRSRSLTTLVPVFFVLGVLLSLTPCVLPMLPVVSSIIVGQHAAARDRDNRGMSKAHGFMLALAYAAGMVIVYTAFGIAAGLAGEGLAAALQQPWILTLFAALLVALALSLFGFYELQLPSSVQTYLARISSGRSAGRLAGVFAMGAISALIVGPCVAAPLAGALLYISETRDVVIGGSALFALAAGMSVPLLLLGAGAGWLLPRAGPWMQSVKRLFGALLVAVALWTISPLIPSWAQMLCWAAFFIVGASYLRVFDSLPADASGWLRLWKGVGLLMLAAGAVQIVGAAGGARDPLRPLEPALSSRAVPAPDGPTWTRIESVEQLDAALAIANGKPLLLDFYADWCVSCKEMERYTLGDPRVTARLSGFRLLRADVTANDDRDKALLKRFRLFGPPATILFDAQGREVPSARIIGFERPDPFLRTLQAIAERGSAGRG